MASNTAPKSGRGKTLVKTPGCIIPSFHPRSFASNRRVNMPSIPRGNRFAFQRVFEAGEQEKGACLDGADERQLIARAQAEDAAAYEALVRRYQTLAFRTAWLITGERATAEDATQNAF